MSKFDDGPIIVPMIAFLLVGAVLGASVATGLHEGASRKNAVATEYSKKVAATSAFVNGICEGRNPCEGRVGAGGDGAPMVEYRLIMGNVYDRNGNKAVLPAVCLERQTELGSKCSFTESDPADVGSSRY